jgi:transposase
VTVAPPTIPEIDLQAIPAEVRGAVAALLELVRGLVSENRLLRDRLDLLVRRYFGGRKNEQVPSQELQMLLEGFTKEFLAAAPKPAEASKEPPVVARKATSKPVRTGVPDNLPVRNSQVLIPTQVQEQPEHFREIDRTTTRILDYEPGRFVADEIIRPRYVRKDASNSENQPAPADTAAAPVSSAAATPAAVPVSEAEVIVAPLPNRLIEKGLPGVGLLTHVVLSRFQDHLPYYRQEKVFAERHDVRISRQTMCGWIEELEGWFEPLIGLIKEQMLRSRYIQVDETFVRYLDPEVRGKSQRGYFWVYTHPGGDVLFDWQTGRSANLPKSFLSGYEGRIQCDGYRVYPKLARELGKCTLHFCAAHLRRKFLEAKDETPRAAWYLLQFRHLYDIERRLRVQGAGPRLRAAVRASEARPIWNRIRKAMEIHSKLTLPANRLVTAIRYGTDRWEGYLRYIDDGEVEIDSNFVENAIRPTAIGKKNFLFVGHPDAGGRSAVMYSIIGSCRNRGINPALYLKDVLTRLPDMKTSELKDYTPEAWAKRHPEARLRNRK